MQLSFCRRKKTKWTHSSPISFKSVWYSSFTPEKKFKKTTPTVIHMRNMSDQIDFSQTSDKIDADVPIKPEIINDIMDLSLKPSPSSKLVI